MFAAAAALAVSSVHAQPPVETVSIECNWGTLTMTSIESDGDGEGGPILAGTHPIQVVTDMAEAVMI